MKGKKVLVMALAAAMMPFAAFAQPTDSWTGSCQFDNDFRTQGTTLAALAPALSLPFPNWDSFDIDADGVSDAWQCQLLAYALCSGNAQVTADYAANGAQISNLVNEFTTLVTYLSTKNAAITAFGNELNALQGGQAACNSPAGLAAYPPLDTYFALIQGSFDGVTTIGDAFVAVGTAMAGYAGDYTPFPPLLGAIAGVLTAESGMSTESRTTINGIVPVSDVAALGQALQVLAGLCQYEQGCGAATMNGQLATDAGALITTIGTAPSLTALSTVVYDLGAKATGEDFAGAGDYNNDGTTNAQVAGFVSGAGGDANDFVAGATGNVTDFWAGNPGLPVAGVLGLASAVMGLGAAGALRLRRRK